MSENLNKAMPIAWSVIEGVTIIFGKNSVTWEHVNRDAILECLRNEEWDKIDDLITYENAINKFGEGKLKVVGNEVTYNGQNVDGALHERILSMISMKLPVTPLVRFLDRIQLNPSRRVIKELFNFLDKGQLPLTVDGCFLARKVVRGDFMDYHSGTIDWSPGNIVEMNRNEVDDDPQSTCSFGLHVYNRDYGRTFMRSGGKFLVVEVAPEDVVAIPYDYDGAKMRICKATVVQEITNEDDPEFFNSLVYSTRFDYEDDKDEDYTGVCSECGCPMQNDDTICDECAYYLEHDCNDCGCTIYNTEDSLCEDCVYVAEHDCSDCGATMYNTEECIAAAEKEDIDDNNPSGWSYRELCDCVNCTKKREELKASDPFADAEVAEEDNSVEDLSCGSGCTVWVFRK